MIQTFIQAKAELDALLTAVFTGTWSTIAQNAAAPATNVYVSLHTADPLNGGSQTTNEAAYTSYARVAVARTTGGWTTTLGSGTTFSSVTNAASITFPACTGGSETETHWGIGLSSSGAGTLLLSGPIGPVAGPDVPFTCTNASPGVITCYGYTPTVNDRVSVYQLPGSEGLNTGLTEGTVYFVGTAPGGQTLTLSTTTANGNPVNTTSTGSGIIIKQGPLAVSSGITPAFAAGQLSYQKG
jgi:hypothetical protein